MSIKMNIDPLTFFNKVGIEAAKSAEIAKGFQVIFAPASLKIAKDGVVKVAVPVSAVACQKFYDGAMSNVEAASFKKTIKQAVSSLDVAINTGSVLHKPATPGQAPNVLKPAVSDPGEAVTLGHLLAAAINKAGIDPNKVDPAKPAPDKVQTPAIPSAPAPETHVGVVKTFPVEKMSTAPLKPLTSATMLYEPVQGTSAGSRYFVVALSQDARVAIKYDSGSLSLRIEGPGFLKHKAKMEKLGLTVKGTYASVHLDVGGGGVELAGKAVGAILMGLDIPMLTPLPSMGVIAKYGK